MVRLKFLLSDKVTLRGLMIFWPETAILFVAVLPLSAVRFTVVGATVNDGVTHLPVAMTVSEAPPPLMT